LLVLKSTPNHVAMRSNFELLFIKIYVMKNLFVVMTMCLANFGFGQISELGTVKSRTITLKLFGGKEISGKLSLLGEDKIYIRKASKSIVAVNVEDVNRIKVNTSWMSKTGGAFLGMGLGMIPAIISFTKDSLDGSIVGAITLPIGMIIGGFLGAWFGKADEVFDIRGNKNRYNEQTRAIKKFTFDDF